MKPIYLRVGCARFRALDIISFAVASKYHPLSEERTFVRRTFMSRDIRTEIKEYITSLTFLPTWLLCRLNAVRASVPFSSLSIKRLVSFSPNLMSSLQPPHCQSLFPFGCFLVLPRLHPGILFCLHCRVSSWVMAAALMAWRKAVSRVAAIKIIQCKENWRQRRRITMNDQAQHQQGRVNKLKVIP